MATPEILYTDGHHVTVTPSKLKIKGLTYWLSAIKRHNLAVVPKDRVAGIMCVFMGLGFLLFGLLLLISPPESEASIGGIVVNPGLICLVAGGFTLGLGILLNAILKEKFAVRIVTEDGETDVIVSSSMEYVTQIVDALNEAFSRLDLKKSTQRKQAFL